MTFGTTLKWFSEADVRACLSMDEAISAVESAFGAFGRGEARMPSKVYLDFAPHSGDLRSMPAYLMGSIEAAGVKIVNSNPANPAKNLPAVSGVLIYVDPSTGLPVALMAAGALTAIRTGAAGGVAAKHLARPGAFRVGLVGCGRQALAQLEALSRVMTIRDVSVWGPTARDIDGFFKLAEGAFSFPMKAASSVRVACDADVVVTTTPVREPLVQSDFIAPGTHINAIGADAPGKQELDPALLARSLVFVDEWSQASHGGEINKAVSGGVFDRNACAGQLGDLVSGRCKGRQSAEDITIFDSTGLAIQDIAVAKVIVENAAQNNKGQVLNFNG